MITKLVTMILMVTTINFICAASAFAQTDKDAQRFSQVKHDVEKLGFDQKVEVRLQDGSIVNHISGIAHDQFVITDKQGANRKFFCASTRRVAKDPGSTSSQIGLLAPGVGLPWG